MNPFEFFGRIFAGGGTKTGSGIALYAAQPLAEFVLAMKPGLTLKQAAAESLVRVSYGLIGGGLLHKVIKGDVPLPWVRPAAPAIAAESEVADK